MMNDAARRLVLYDGSASVALGASREGGLVSSAWTGGADELALVLDGASFESMLSEAARWAERITLCVTAPQSQRGSLPWWGELLARSSKCDRIYVRRPEQAEGWLLHRLHDTGALRCVDGGGKQVASNVLWFARGSEVRVLFSHLSLERAVAGAGFGALLSFRGSSTGELARACRAQAESWSELGWIPTGSDIDALSSGARRAEPPAALEWPASALSVVSEPAALEACLRRLAAAAQLNVRAFTGGYQLQLPQGKGRPSFPLTLCAGAAWASGNALMLQAGDGQEVLVWRGGLLGHSRSRGDLLWSEARLHTLLLEDAALGPAQRVALVAESTGDPAAQLARFASEVARLGEVFSVEPPPALGHALADFTSLSPKQQTLLLWRALLGLGALDFGVAALTAAQVLRDQGYVRSSALQAGTGLYGVVAELLSKAAESGLSFDRPSTGQIRAIQPELSAYVLDDWLECMLLALPEGKAVPRSRALRLTFERARTHWGLRGHRLSRDSAVERALESSLASALRRGLLLRVGAGAVQRVPRSASPPARALPSARTEACTQGLLAGWSRALERLAPVQRLVLSRRAGWHGRREALESVAQRLGVSLERARQIEVEAWQSIERDSAWLRTARARLERALSGARCLPVHWLASDDPWWQGAELHLGLVEALLESAFGGELHCVSLHRGEPGARSREVFLARFPQAELDQALAGLLERAARLSTPARLSEYEPLIAEAAGSLDGCLEEPFREELCAHLDLEAGEPDTVQGFVARPGAELEHLPLEPGVDSERRLRLEDAARWAFRTAHTPLSLSAAAERIRQRLDVEEATLAELLSHAPFVQRNADQYGLLSRDVPGGPDAIASALNTVVDALEMSQRPLAVRQAFALVQAQVKQAWSQELVRSLLASDPALCLAPSRDLTLRRWEHARLLPLSELSCPGVPAAARPRFDKLRQEPLQDPAELLRRVRAVLGRLERASAPDELLALALARQLGDLYERLLEELEHKPVAFQQLAEAAVRHFIEALSGDDDDDLEAPAAHRAPLREARAVLAAVLKRLELDWL